MSQIPGVPYRDPETLKSFLKEINLFSYDHSERLGDAGQFRTPRHIIDFLVRLSLVNSPVDLASGWTVWMPSAARCWRVGIRRCASSAHSKAADRPCL